MKFRSKIFLIALGCLAPLLSIPASINAETSSAIPTIFQPFSLSYHNYPKHVMLYFQGHPEYESMEAMIIEHEQQPATVRIILTRNDQTQVDYLNAPEAFRQFRLEAPQREAYLTEIAYQTTYRKEAPETNIDFVTNKQEKVSFHLIAADKPSAKHGGLTDPEGHAMLSAFPVITREQSMLASPESSISFNGVKYELPVHTYVPFIFKGMKGYYTDGFRIGIIAQQRNHYSLPTLPEELAPGTTWKLQKNGQELSYVVEEREGNLIKISTPNEEIILLERAESAVISEIRRRASEKTDERMVLRFDPYLPTFGSTWPERVEFDIRFENTKPLVSGLVRKTDSGFELQASSPDWAKKRIVRTRFSGNGKDIETTIGPLPQ